MSKTTKIVSLVLMVAVLIIAGAVIVSRRSNQATTTTTTSQKEGKTVQNPKTLIVYYSRTGNTKAVAEIIQSQVGGDLVQIETKSARPTNYRAEVEQNETEQNTDTLPALKSLPDLSQYDRIFIGSPTWNMALPQAVVAFLRANKFTGKTVIPFNTNGGYGVGSVFTQIKQEAKGATVLQGFSIKGGEEINGVLLAIRGNRRVTVSKSVTTWLKSIKQTQ